MFVSKRKKIKPRQYEITAQEGFIKYLSPILKRDNSHLTKEDATWLKPFIRGGFIAMNEEYKDKIVSGNFEMFDIHKTYISILGKGKIPYGSLEKNIKDIDGDIITFKKVYCRWTKRLKFVPNMLWVRHKDGTINYPENGEGWLYLIDQELEFYKSVYDIEELDIECRYMRAEPMHYDSVFNKVMDDFKNKENKELFSALVGYTALNNKRVNIYSPIFIVVCALCRLKVMRKILQIKACGHDWVYSATDSVLVKLSSAFTYYMRPYEVGKLAGQWDYCFKTKSKKTRLFIKSIGLLKLEEPNGRSLIEKVAHLKQMLYWKYMRENNGDEPTDRFLETQIKLFRKQPITYWKKTLEKMQFLHFEIDPRKVKKIV